MDVVLIWILTRTARSLPIVWAFALMVLLLVAVLGLGYVFSRSIESVATSRLDPALEELRIAYARGEITREEFRERRTVLRGEHGESSTELHRAGGQKSG
ncbi:MAG: SHOCT domain-containing protein [Haloarcula sp.]